MRNYGVARSLFGIMELMFWTGVVVGIIVAFAAMGVASRGFGGGPGILAAIPGIVISILSLFGVALIQNGRAAVDTAELTQQMLKVARDQLSVSEQSLKQGDSIQRSFAALANPREESPPFKASGSTKASYGNTKQTDQPAQIPAVEDSSELRVHGKTLTYRGQQATLESGKWHLNGIAFDSRELLRDYIDVYGKNASSKSSHRAAK